MCLQVGDSQDDELASGGRSPEEKKSCLGICDSLVILQVKCLP